MSREKRFARLVGHRERQVELAAAQLEHARSRTRAAETTVRAIDEAIVAARAESRGRTAGELAESDAHVRGLAARRTRAAAHVEALRRAEQDSQKHVVDARVELKKMVTILDAIRQANAEVESRDAQRAVDDRSARSGAGDARDRA